MDWRSASNWLSLEMIEQDVILLRFREGVSLRSYLKLLTIDFPSIYLSGRAMDC